MSSPADGSGGGPGWEESMELLDSLPGLALAERAEVLEHLVRSPSPGVRERALRVGAAVLSDQVLVEYMRREGDAVLRNAGLEILKHRGGSSFSVAVGLLGEEDPQMVLQAVLILDHLNDPRAVEPLRAVLAHDDPNVVQAAIVAIGHLGDARTIPDLLPFLEAEPWLQCAAIQALGSLRAPAGVEPLAKLLTDLSIGTLAAEALAQIGGRAAFAALERHWLEFQEHLDPEAALGLLAHVLEGLAERPSPAAELKPSLAARLRDPYRGVRQAAARCLLALGPGAEDGEALSILAAGREDDGRLPSCLEARPDLVDRLLSQPALLRMWGLRLLARYPGSASPESLARALDEVTIEGVEQVETVARALAGGGAGVGRPLLDLYLRLGPDERAVLRPAVAAHREAVEAAIETHADLAPQERVVLAVVLGEGDRDLRQQILELEPEARIEAISQLADRPEAMRDLPWQEWLAEEPARYGNLASRVAVAANLRDLLPALRRLLLEAPAPAVVRALGELGDSEALPELLRLVEGAGPLGPVVVECLGRIGGPEARRALRGIAKGGDEKLARMAYHALAECAIEDDEAFFREVAAHPDWYVRLASAEVLGRFDRPENLETLARLAADPVEIVAQRARAALEG
ncbi:MAG: HEAT repeat domain-containing protein [Thermoanaerobaculia bacterium]|nr:HEAT repeat domain-containing protein [Thermoanaerobaculia bacterium]